MGALPIDPAHGYRPARLFDDFEGAALNTATWETVLWKTNCSRHDVSLSGGFLNMDVGSTKVGDKGCDLLLVSKRECSCGSPGSAIAFRRLSHPYWRGGSAPSGSYRDAYEGLSSPPGTTTGAEFVKFAADEKETRFATWVDGAGVDGKPTAIDPTRAFDLEIRCVAGALSW